MTRRPFFIHINGSWHEARRTETVRRTPVRLTHAAQECGAPGGKAKKETAGT